MEYEYSTIAAMDANVFNGDTLKEKYEVIFVKIFELAYILAGKAALAGHPPVDKYRVRLGEYSARLFRASSSSGELPSMKRLQDCLLFFEEDASLAPNVLVIEGDAKAKLTIHNLMV